MIPPIGPRGKPLEVVVDLCGYRTRMFGGTAPPGCRLARGDSHCRRPEIRKAAPISPNGRPPFKFETTATKRS